MIWRQFVRHLFISFELDHSNSVCVHLWVSTRSHKLCNVRIWKDEIASRNRQINCVLMDSHRENVIKHIKCSGWTFSHTINKTSSHKTLNITDELKWKKMRAFTWIRVSSFEWQNFNASREQLENLKCASKYSCIHSSFFLKQRNRIFFWFSVGHGMC